jgi:hypothetical protein
LPAVLPLLSVIHHVLFALIMTCWLSLLGDAVGLMSRQRTSHANDTPGLTLRHSLENQIRRRPRVGEGESRRNLPTPHVPTFRRLTQKKSSLSFPTEEAPFFLCRRPWSGKSPRHTTCSWRDKHFGARNSIYAPAPRHASPDGALNASCVERSNN